MKIIKTQANVRKLRAIVVALMILVNTRRTCVERRWWIRPWLKKKMGNSSLVQEFIKTDPEQFKRFLRMDENLFSSILDKISPKITKKDTYMRESISARDNLTITLRFLATGETYRSLMYAFRISESTISLFVPEVCKAIYDSLKNEYLKVPKTPAEWLNISKEFHELWNLPNIIGALDGKHIVFRAPRSAGSTFFNYKNENSIILLALADANYKFIYVDVGTNGRVSDGGVFRKSSLYAAMVQEKLNLLEDKPLPLRRKLMPHVFMADAAFPLQQHIMKPFPFRNMSSEQNYFNYRLSRARCVIENSFGILANRFRIFLTTINLAPEKNGEDYDPDYSFKFGVTRQAGNRTTNAAIEIRHEFMEYVNSEGKL